MPDLMMTNGDLSVTRFGDVAVVDIDDDIIQSAIHNIMCIYGEYQFNRELGNPVYLRKNKLSPTNLKVVEHDCHDAILNDNRVASVRSIEATKNDAIYGQCNIAFSLLTLDGKLLSSRVAIIL